MSIFDPKGPKVNGVLHGKAYHKKANGTQRSLLTKQGRPKPEDRKRPSVSFAPISGSQLDPSLPPRTIDFWQDLPASFHTPMPAEGFASGTARPLRAEMAPAVSLRGVTKRYGELLAVDHLDLSIRQGEIFGFLGPNGAGKTTTIQMLCGLLKPDEGEIQILGESLSDGVHVRERIGVCPQQLVIWGKMTALEQLVFLAESYDIPQAIGRERALSMLEALGLWEKRNALAKDLSGGMKRRLNLLMALIHEPSILVLDEPEAGLDPQSRVLVREYIEQWVQEDQRTVILTSHNIDEVERLAHRVAIIDRGCLLSLDTPDTLKSQLHHGDLLEIELVDAAQPYLDDALFVLQQLASSLSCEGTQIEIRLEDNLIEGVSSVLGVLRRYKIPVQGLRMRPCTLEDVFISLTGRALRDH